MLNLVESNGSLTAWRLSAAAGLPPEAAAGHGVAAPPGRAAAGRRAVGKGAGAAEGSSSGEPCIYLFAM